MLFAGRGNAAGLVPLLIRANPKNIGKDAMQPGWSASVLQAMLQHGGLPKNKPVPPPESQEAPAGASPRDQELQDKLSGSRGDATRAGAAWPSCPDEWT